MTKPSFTSLRMFCPAAPKEQRLCWACLGVASLLLQLPAAALLTSLSGCNGTSHLPEAACLTTAVVVPVKVMVDPGCHRPSCELLPLVTRIWQAACCAQS